jgi:hypothetical protein
MIKFCIGGSDVFKRMEPWALIRYLQKKNSRDSFRNEILEKNLVTIKKNWPSIPAIRLAPSVALYKLSTLDYAVWLLRPVQH